MTQPAPVDQSRLEALYAAVEIAKINASQNLATASQVVEDARTIHAFLASSQACGPTEG